MFLALASAACSSTRCAVPDASLPRIRRAAPDTPCCPGCAVLHRIADAARAMGYLMPNLPGNLLIGTCGLSFTPRGLLSHRRCRSLQPPLSCVCQEYVGREERGRGGRAGIRHLALCCASRQGQTNQGPSISEMVRCLWSRLPVLLSQSQECGCVALGGEVQSFKLTSASILRGNAGWWAQEYACR